MGGVGNTDRHPRLQELFQSLRCIRSVLVCTIFHKPVVFRKREFNCRGIVRFQIPCKSSRYKPTLISPIKMIHKRKLDIFKFSWGVFRQKICFSSSSCHQQRILDATIAQHSPPSCGTSFHPDSLLTFLAQYSLARAGTEKKLDITTIQSRRNFIIHVFILFVVRLKFSKEGTMSLPPFSPFFLILIFTLLFVNRFQHEIFFFLLLNSHLSLILKKDRLTSRGYMQIIRCGPGNIYLPAEKTRKYQKS